jgi:glycosyltransferase involved in cell wall biosynthesis
LAAELTSHGVEAVSDLEKLSTAPDVIHGHHHAQVVEALLHFPTAPALYVCHSGGAEIDEPFYFPRILRYVAVDNRCRARLESAPGIPAQRIEVVLNAVDLQRFQARSKLPARPRRALIFSNYASRSTHLPAVRRACRRLHLEFDVLGELAGTGVVNPETVLPRYDLVFAKARCALEAMATGSAVVLCDFAGAGPMVTSENFDRLRSWNFGAGVLVNPLRPEYITPEIEQYDPEDAARVQERVREQAGLQAAAQRWSSLYAEVVREFQRSEPDREGELRALAVYLRKWSYATGREPLLNLMKRVRRIPGIGNELGNLARKLGKCWSRG